MTYRQWHIDVEVGVDLREIFTDMWTVQAVDSLLLGSAGTTGDLLCNDLRSFCKRCIFKAMRAKAIIPCNGLENPQEYNWSSKSTLQYHCVVLPNKTP